MSPLQAAAVKETVCIERMRDPQATFDAIVDWVANSALARNMPGVMVGISGTDSILAFLVCARAFEKIGKADRVVGIHYGAVFPPAGKAQAEVEKIIEINPTYRWVQRKIMPWLAEQAPQAQLHVDSSIDYNDDYARWAALFRSSLNGAMRTEALSPENCYWIAGTRNATERALGAYSNISGAVSLQPLIHLWKSDVLKICAARGVPDMALEQSRQVDCDCGRFDIAADNIEGVDLLLQAREGIVTPQEAIAGMTPDLARQLNAFIEKQIADAAFKREIPYAPTADVLR